MRAIVALIAIVAAIAAAVVFANTPGQVEILWRDWQIDTSVGVLIAAVLLFGLVLWAVVLMVSGLLHLPGAVRHRGRVRRRRAGERALTRGMIALAGGDPAEASRQTRRAERLLGEEPLVLLLAAQTAQLCRDEPAARRAFIAMQERPDLAFVGLRGLFALAAQTGDRQTALRLAQRARLLHPESAWLAEGLLGLQTATGDWPAAAATLADAARRGIIPAERARRHRGVILYELSRTAERNGELREAARLAARAQALLPALAAPAAHYAQALLALGRKRAAAKAIERAWRTAADPELARAYAAIHSDAAPLAQMGAIKRLAAQNPEAAESQLAVAEVALAAQLWGEARHHLGRAAALTFEPSRRLCLMMARLEEGEHGNTAAARDWLNRAAGAPPDRSYVCARCGAAGPEWRTLCPACGGFDTLAPGRPSRAGTLAGVRSSLPLQPPATAAPALAGADPLGGAGTMG